MPDKENKPDKIKIDSKTLQGLIGVGSLHGEKPNPKHVVIWLHDPEESKFIPTKEELANPFIYTVLKPKMLKEKLESTFANILADHVKKYGTIEELYIEGHGHKLNQSDGKGGNNLSIPKFLAYVQLMNWEIDIKIADRIVFNGCNTFSKLSEQNIKLLRHIADETDTEIVGTTSLGHWNRTEGTTARFVQFTPKGEVNRDKLDNRFPISVLLKYPDVLKEVILKEDRSWIDYHLNHTQEEGEKLKSNHIKQEAEAKKYWGNVLNKLSNMEYSREH